LHNFPDSDWLNAAYKTAGFAIVESDIFTGNGSDGTVRDWMALTVQKT